METGVILTLLVLAATAVLFITGIVRVDVAAVLVAVVLAWPGLVTPRTRAPRRDRPPALLLTAPLPEEIAVGAVPAPSG